MNIVASHHETDKHHVPIVKYVSHTWKEQRLKKEVGNHILRPQTRNKVPFITAFDTVKHYSSTKALMGIWKKKINDSQLLIDHYTFLLTSVEMLT